ncbi:MAG: isoleucine--tRNA ligase [Minisyncoccia bacterium]
MVDFTNFKKIEEEVLNFWQENKIFEKSIDNRPAKRPFVFYEGPPTANGKPGIHHVLARSFKDLICRYKTMKGFRVIRKAGWDTHGLPVEIEVEKALGFKNKTQIEEFGIEEFNEKAKESVWQYKKQWEDLTSRMGYWIDLKNPYITFEPNYIETIWWLLKKIDEKGLLYKSYKVLPYCPRCSTPLSSHEVSLGYKTVKDPSVYVKFPLSLSNEKISSKFQIQNSQIYLLVWTTTPWTLPNNTAIAVNKDLKYKLLFNEKEKEYLITYNLPSEADSLKLIKELKGKELIGLKYEPLFKYPLNQNQKEKKNYEVVGADFVSFNEGTGLVHIAPAYGEEDMELSKKENLLFLKSIDDKGFFVESPQELQEIKGKFFKEADPIIFENLKSRNLLFGGDLKGTIHEYPFCWRCDTPLMYYAFEAFYIKVSQIRRKLIQNNQKINWIPSHIKEGRFGQWLKEAKDWAISRNRYWGTPLPVWECEKCGYYKVIGSIEELPQKPLNKKGEIDLHRPFVDEIVLKCPKCGGEMKRRKEVLDCWFDSGAMPYAQYHFPFEFIDHKNLEKIDYKKLIKKIPFPADFISEAIDQTRGWFYTLLAISSLLDLGPGFKNVICLGLVLDKNGEKMSKSKGNVVNPFEMIEKYGADAVRWYLFSLNPPGEEKRFNEEEILVFKRRSLLTLINVYVFYETYAYKGEGEINKYKLSLLDKWILAELEKSKLQITKYLDQYLVFEATKEIDKFIDNLSRWYLRRKRRIFQKPENKKEWVSSSLVLRKVLRETILILAPFCPFITEYLWQKIKYKKDKESVHLADFPLSEKKYQDSKILKEMEKIREIAYLSLSLRQKAKIKVRQPLKKLKIKNDLKVKKELLEILKEEINVKSIIFDKNIPNEIELNTEITPELKEEGIIRELIRQIQEQRKNQKLTLKDKVILNLYTPDKELKEILEKNQEKLAKETIAKKLIILKEKPQKAEKLDFDQEIWLLLDKEK